MVNHGEKVSIEKVLSEMGQIADLFVGDSLALEVQCSRLSQQRLRDQKDMCTITNTPYRSALQVSFGGEELWLNGRLIRPARRGTFSGGNFSAKIDFT